MNFDESNPLSYHTTSVTLQPQDVNDNKSDLDEILNADISIQELNEATAKLKRGKAVGEDCIAN